MSQLYYGLVTNKGLAKLAAAAAGGPALSLTSMAFGDGGGAETAPSNAATALVNERYRTLLAEKYPHPTNPAILYVEGIIPSGVGGWTLREAGIYDAAGDLIVIAKLPAMNVALLADGASTEGLVRLPIVFETASSVQMLVDPTVLLASQSWVLERVLTRPFITVDSATTTAPPASPAAHMLYLVPTGATGAWAGKQHQLAYYLGGWRFYAAPIGKRVAASDTGKVFRRIATGWEALWVEQEASLVISKSGIVEAAGSGNRLARAVRSQRLNNLGAPTGTANALIVTFDPAPNNVAELARMPIRIMPAFTNTAAVNVTIPGIGVFPLLTRTGRPLRYGDLRAGVPTVIEHDGDVSMRLTAPANSEIGGPMRRLRYATSATFTAGPGEFLLHIYGHGAAGGGGRCVGLSGAGAGGGSGAYCDIWLPIEPDLVIPLALGAGGTRGIISSPDGGDGGSCLIDGIVSITGGKGGTAGVVGGGGVGGEGGIATILNDLEGFVADGKTGGTAIIITDTNMVGGFGAPAPFGGGKGGGPNQGTGGDDGGDPGGGGGGGANSAGSNGGRGGNPFFRFETFPG
ncbi:hypothetical protein J2X65_002050 [Ancylobacter sp. 3268]|uniref:phage tail-collar fiber domain-containing protein n=1 Tax=Ancylobacter sp. 3268 TaxID=2817752 RepID=UPI002859591F|nr:phage tail protein [Ancylobacter sp. 3268]MDR6952691.1 hypothetical protein [Ancylobacter sp. 3268]